MGTRVEILGQEYRIEGEQENYLKEIAKYVDKQLKQLQEVSPSYSSGRLGILVSLNMADQLQKLKQKHKSLINQLLNSIDKLITDIDNIIEVQQTAVK